MSHLAELQAGGYAPELIIEVGRGYDRLIETAERAQARAAGRQEDPDA